MFDIFKTQMTFTYFTFQSIDFISFCRFKIQQVSFCFNGTASLSNKIKDIIYLFDYNYNFSNRALQHR